MQRKQPKKASEHELDLSAGLLRVPEVQKLFAVSRSQIYQLMRDGKLAYVRVEADRRIPPAAVERYMRARLVEAPA